MIFKQITKITANNLFIIINLSHSLTSIPSYNFSSLQPQQKSLQLLSKQTLIKFQSLLKSNISTNIQKAAQLYAEIQTQIQKNQQIIKQNQKIFNLHSQNVRKVVQNINAIQSTIYSLQQQMKLIDKRVEKQILNCKKYSVSTIVKDILDIADCLTKSKGLSITYLKTQNHQLLSTVAKAQHQLKQIFQAYGIQQFDPTGKQYDPNKQESLSTTPAPNPQLKNKVANTIRTGYTINGRLLRSAHVSIYL